jgi:hypothetical protein
MNMIPMIPITPKVVNAISMSAIGIYLRTINKESHHELAYIIAVLGEVVYLAFVRNAYVVGIGLAKEIL